MEKGKPTSLRHSKVSETYEFIKVVGREGSIGAINTNAMAKKQKSSIEMASVYLKDIVLIDDATGRMIS